MGNKVAEFIGKIGIFTWVFGFVLGIFMGNIDLNMHGELDFDFDDGEFIWSKAFAYWCYSFIFGALIFGFEEVIELLNTIKNEMKENTASTYRFRNDLKNILNEKMNNQE